MQLHCGIGNLHVDRYVLHPAPVGTYQITTNFVRSTLPLHKQREKGRRKVFRSTTRALNEMGSNCNSGSTFGLFQLTIRNVENKNHQT